MAITPVSAGAIAASGSPSFGQSTTAGNLLVAWVGSNGSTASGTITTAAAGWAQADVGGGPFAWGAVWYKPNCGAGETAPVFTDSAGSVFYSRLAEYAGAAASSVTDQHGHAYSGGGNAFWAINPAPDADAGDLVCVAGFWSGANGGGTVSVTRFTDSAGADITQHLATAANGSGMYFASLWGVAGNTGGNGDYAFLNLSAFNAGGGALVSFKPASPVLNTLTIPAQALPATWLDFPYPTRTLQATGGTPPYTWAVTSGSLPAGLSLSAAGVLSGSSVTAAGTFGFTAQVTDSASRTASASLSVTVNAAPSGTSLTTTTSLTGNLGPYDDPAAMTPASDGFNTYVAANQVGPTGSYSQTLGAYSPSVFYVAASAGPPGTGQVQMGPCNSQQFTTWNGAGWAPAGSQNTPLAGLASWTATHDVTNPSGGAWELEHDIWTGYVGGGGASTSVASGSNGGSVASIASWSAPSPGVLDVASTAGFPSSGVVLVAVSGNAQAFVSYTGITATSFTGCALVAGSATGTVSAGGFVCQPNARDIMVWLDTSDERGAGGAILHTANLTFGAHTFDFYYYPFPYPDGPVAGAELIFILQGAGGSGTFGHLTSGTVDLLGPLNWLTAQGFDLGNSGSPNWIPRAATPYLTLNLFGWEICNTDSIPGSAAVTTTENFIVNNFQYGYTLSGGHYGADTGAALDACLTRVYHADRWVRY